MRKTTYHAIIKEMVGGTGGQGYFVRLHLANGKILTGSWFNIPNMEEMIGLMDHGPKIESDPPPLYLDLAAVIGIEGPYLDYPEDQP